jgi:hypothetical protein
MASTRNKNTFINYQLEQRENEKTENWELYVNGANGYAYDVKEPGFGLNPGQFPMDSFSNNSADVESFLFGINSTNLTKKEKGCFTPEIKKLNTVNLIKEKQIIMPSPFILKSDERPMILK